MEKIYIITNRDKDQDLMVTKKICEYLREHACDCFIQEERGACDNGKHYATDLGQIPEGVEGIIVLGGDGTLIQAAHDMAAGNIPLLGINLGTLGYLTEIGREDIDVALDALLQDNYEIEERMMLEGQVLRQGNRGQDKSLALNDIVLNRVGALRVVNYHVYVNDKYLTTYQADGMIVATPTGSTGYSMSAGGPIIAPCSRMSVVTPICSHALNNRSIVLEASDQIRICVESLEASHCPEAVVNFDAAHSVQLQGGDCIEICKSQAVTRLLKVTKDSFLQNLGKKFR